MLTTATSRTGGPRRSNSRPPRYERYEVEYNVMAHMPLDTDMHWTWSNPINIIPALVLLFALVALVASLSYLF